MSRLLIAIACAALGLAHAQNAAPERAGVERRIASIQKLIESSSAAREVEAGGRPEALTRRNEARQSVRLARAALEANDVRAAAALAEEAARHLIGAARLARDAAPAGAGGREEVAGRMESARALGAAMRRIAPEKDARDVPALAARVDALLAEAGEHLDAGRTAAARAAADQAYLLAKASVTALRGGDTLVRSLHFASKEEEYHYELDRNDTHRMLLALFLKRGGVDPADHEGAGRSARLRADAEARATAREHAEAVRLLEESTRELVRAIRAAGVFIPG